MYFLFIHSIIYLIIYLMFRPPPAGGDLGKRRRHKNESDLYLQHYH